MTNTPYSIGEWRKTCHDQAEVISVQEYRILKLQSALEEIAGGTKILKRPGGGAQICLSALDMQKIADDVLTLTK